MVKASLVLVPCSSWLSPIDTSYSHLHSFQYSFASLPQGTETAKTRVSFSFLPEKQVASHTFFAQYKGIEMKQ